MFFFQRIENGNSFRNFIRLIANFNDPIAGFFFRLNFIRLQSILRAVN